VGGARDEHLIGHDVDDGVGRILELPAVAIRAGEHPEAALHRLCHSESHVEPESYVLVGSFYPSPGACSEKVTIYYVRAKAVGEISSETREAFGLQRVDMKPSDFLRHIEDGSLVDAKSIVAAEWMRRPSSADDIGR
jgi:ADP-ribose pyrophosphatase